ncbi:septum formation family protein [Actinomadura napierensis]|uniref:Septum formation-related domain-containing protein n=1 Tax=Actinomadura napierensis TaxID=267854 RepID=A0ABN3A7I3_9ACTN
MSTPDSPETAPMPPDANVWAPPDAPFAEPAQPLRPAESPQAPAPLGRPVHAPPFFSAPAPRRTNRFAIVALVTGLVGLVVFAIGFAIAALVQAGRRNEKGRGLAIGALAASAAWIIALTTTAVVVTTSTHHSDDPVADPEFKNGKPGIAGLYIGDCFTGFEEDLNRTYVTMTPCTKPHQGEIGGKVTMPASSYPGDGALVAEATKKCKEQTRHLMNSRFAAHLEFRLDRPRRAAWEHGDRDVTCVLLYTGDERLVDSLSHLTWGLRYSVDLIVGDCIDKWDDDGVRTVDCAKAHKYQLYATYELRGETYPGVNAVRKKAAEGCIVRAAKLFGADPPNGVMPVQTTPSKDDWVEGEQRRVLCLFEAVGGPLRRSVMPG